MQNPEPDVIKYNKKSERQYDLILGTETMKELGIVLDFKAKAITIDKIT
jgi:hypothetical protein